MQHNNIFSILVHLGGILPTMPLFVTEVTCWNSNLTEYILKEKILISTGGSGGHVIPALNFYDHLKNDYEVYLITDLRGSKFINSEVYKNHIIDVPDFKKNILKIPLNLILFIISIIKSLIFLKKNKINKIISTGGYMTLPTCIASRFINSKLFLFEPNMVLGRSIIFINQCKKIFCYSNSKKFPNSNYLPNFKKKILYL